MIILSPKLVTYGEFFNTYFFTSAGSAHRKIPLRFSSKILKNQDVTAKNMNISKSIHRHLGVVIREE